MQPHKKQPKERRPFVTGSRAYGHPKKSSDIDLVALVSFTDLQKLKKRADSSSCAKVAPSDGDGSISSASLMFGKLNLIVVTDPLDYDIWEEGTRELIDTKPHTRDEATAYFRVLRKKRKK